MMMAQCFYERTYSHFGNEDRSLLSPHIGSTFMWQMMQDFKGKGTGGSKHMHKKRQYHCKKAQGTQVEGAGDRLREHYMFLSLHDSISLLNPEREPHGLEMCRELQYIPSCAHVAVIKQSLLARRQLSTDLPIRQPLSCWAHWESWCRRCHTEARWGQAADGLYCVFQQRNIAWISGWLQKLSSSGSTCWDHQSSLNWAVVSKK